MPVDNVEPVVVECSRWPCLGGGVGVSRVVDRPDHVVQRDARGVLYGHLVGQLHRPPEPVVRRLRAGMGIDGYHFIHQLGPAISAWRVALQLAVLISSRRILLLLRWKRPERHPPLALQLLPSLDRMTDR